MKLSKGSIKILEGFVLKGYLYLTRDENGNVFVYDSCPAKTFDIRGESAWFPTRGNGFAMLSGSDLFDEITNLIQEHAYIFDIKKILEDAGVEGIRNA